MSPDRFERDIAERLQGVEVPEASRARLEGAVRRATLERATERHSHRRRRRRIIGAVVAFAVLAGSATALGVYLTRDDEGLTVPATPEGRAAIAESAVLAKAPWLIQRNGSPRIQGVETLPALYFPAGTTYTAALQSVYTSIAERGALPASARLGPALPRGLVWREGRSGARPALDLTAPWGYTVPGGRILPPSASVAGNVPVDEANAIFDAFVAGGKAVGVGRAAGARVDVPRLRECQTQTGARPPEPCALQPPLDGR